MTFFTIAMMPFHWVWKSAISGSLQLRQCSKLSTAAGVSKIAESEIEGSMLSCTISAALNQDLWKVLPATTNYFAVLRVTHSGLEYEKPISQMMKYLKSR